MTTPTTVAASELSGGLTRKQRERLAFQAAILARDEVAGYAYADWLEEIGSKTEAKVIRAKLSQPRQGSIRACGLGMHIRCELISKADKLLRSETAFSTGWYGSHRVYSDALNAIGIPDGFNAAVLTGYVPTLDASKTKQSRLGLYLEALGVAVFWIGKKQQEA